jgi:LysM repeat protein
MARARTWIAVIVLMMSACSGGGTKQPKESVQLPSSTAVTAPRNTTKPTVAPPATGTTVPSITYELKRGDTLTAIANRFGVSVAAIATTNHLANADHLVAGQRLRIPPVPPIRLVITPSAAPVGADFHLKLTGAKSSEAITFEIDSPKRKYTGPPHVASTAAVISAIYHSSIGDATGIYNVVAKGNRGTTAHGTFRVNPAATTQTAPTP